MPNEPLSPMEPEQFLEDVDRKDPSNLKYGQIQRFAPSVKIGGETVIPPNFFWIVALAINGDEWALEETKKQGFDEQVKKWQAQRELYHRERERGELVKALTRVDSEIAKLKSKISDE